jgi:serine protease Do
MSTRKTSLFYVMLIVVASVAVGMVLASRLDLSPPSAAQPLGVPPANSAPLGGPIDSTTFRNIAKSVTPAVVNIRTESRQRAQELTDFFGGGGDDLLERFFGGGGGQGRRQQPRDQVAVAAGTGFVISKEGLILTNNHVVEGATSIEVSFYGDDDGVVYKARTVGRDPLTDSALIELTEKPKRDLMEVKFGDSAQMEPGDWVMAIGNPFNLAHTVSVGVISAKDRPFPIADSRWQDVLQTDAAINPGNSGGPLLNVRGEVVGMNSAIYADARQQGNIGIGFAIPINVVRELLPQLRGGKVTRGVIGITVGDVPVDAYAEFGLSERRGALVTSVGQGGPANRAGLEPGDVITEFNGKPIKKRDELVSSVVATKPGTTVPVKVVRDKQERSLNITVDELNLESESPRARRGQAPEQGGDQEVEGFGLTLDTLTAETARRLRLPADIEGVVVTDVDPAGTAARAFINRGDIILQVNRRPVSTLQEASRALDAVPSGGTAFLLILRNGQQTFVTVRKQ